MSMSEKKRAALVAIAELANSPQDLIDVAAGTFTLLTSVEDMKKVGNLLNARWRTIQGAARREVLAQSDWKPGDKVWFWGKQHALTRVKPRLEGEIKHLNEKSVAVLVKLAGTSVTVKWTVAPQLLHRIEGNPGDSPDSDFPDSPLRSLDS